MTERCGRTDLFPSDCGHCKGMDDMRIERPKTRSGTGEQLLGPWFVAKWPGKCCRCQTRYFAFDRIRADWPGPGYISEKCCPRARARRAEAA